MKWMEVEQNYLLWIIFAIAILKFAWLAKQSEGQFEIFLFNYTYT